MSSRATLLLGLLLSVATARCAHAGAAQGASGEDVFDAAKRGDLDAVVRYVRAGGDLEVKDELFGCTPLIIAAQQGHLDVVKALLQARAKLEAYCDIGEWTPLMSAARFGRRDVVAYLVSAGADLDAEDAGDFPRMTAMMLAATAGHFEIAFLLRRAGAKTSIFTAAAMGDAEYVREYIRSGNDVNVESKKAGWYPVEVAAEYGHEEVVELLVDAGANVNLIDGDGGNALRWAELARQPGTAELLRRSGAKDFKVGWWVRDLFTAPFLHDPDYVEDYVRRGGDVEVRNAGGQTPLMYAAFEDANIVKVLIRAKADVNAKDPQGWTALMSSAWKGNNVEGMKLLLRAGADVNAQDRYGWTTLMRAAEEGHVEQVKLLIAAGADLRARNCRGQTALFRARLYRRDEVARVLREAGAE